MRRQRFVAITAFSLLTLHAAPLRAQPLDASLQGELERLAASARPFPSAIPSSERSSWSSITEAKAQLLRHSLKISPRIGVLSPEDHNCSHLGALSCPSSSHAGDLSSADCRLNDGSYVDFYQFAGTAGTTVTIDASSSAFDTVLFLLDPTPNVVALNDDFNSSTDSRIVFTLTSTGTWSIAVNSIGAADFGPYVASLSCTTGGSGCNIAGALSCRSTINGALSTSDCNTGGTTNVYVDFYDFNATAGAPFTVTYSSSAFPLFLTVQEPSAGTVLASQAGSGAISLTYTPTYTGRHVIGIATTQSFATGGYTVSVECGAGAAGCSNSANTLCLSDSRFRVQTSWRVPSQGTSGFGSAVPLTQDSGYFWFFDPGNVELVVKVLNACSFSNFKWVFAAGLTNVEVTMTVTDTRNGMVRTYFNPSGIPYAPIQDTSAFATCP